MTSPIALVVSDVDGTLVTSDKQLTEASRQAIARLAERGIRFAITSSRPPFGMSMLITPLRLQLPLGAFNGSSIVDPTGQPIACHTVSAETVAHGMQMLRDAGIDIWLFTSDDWFIENADNAYVARERHTVQHAPSVVRDLAGHATGICKMVGVSTDFAALAEAETALQKALGSQASVARSQNYYLDITPAGFNKGTFVDVLARQLNLTPDRIAAIGDMRNDLAMFARSGMSFAMGNASDNVKRQATHTTESNDKDGFAAAVARILAT